MSITVIPFYISAASGMQSFWFTEFPEIIYLYFLFYFFFLTAMEMGGEGKKTNFFVARVTYFYSWIKCQFKKIITSQISSSIFIPYQYRLNYCNKAVLYFLKANETTTSNKLIINWQRSIKNKLITNITILKKFPVYLIRTYGFHKYILI